MCDILLSFPSSIPTSQPVLIFNPSNKTQSLFTRLPNSCQAHLFTCLKLTLTLNLNSCLSHSQLSATFCSASIQNRQFSVLE